MIVDRIAAERCFRSVIVVDNGPEFTSKAFSEWAYRRNVHIHYERLDISTPPTLRHGCAKHLLERGTSIVAVQKLLAHAQVATTAL